MGNKEEIVRQYENSRQLYQWLLRVKPWPWSSDRISQKINGVLLSVCGTLFVIQQMFDYYGLNYYSHNNMTLQIIFGIATGILWIEVFMLPILSLFTDFLWYLPLAVQNPKSKSHYEAIFMTPIPTSDILRDLRAWAIRLFRNHVLPILITCLIILFVLLIWDSLKSYKSPYSWFRMGWKYIFLYVIPMIVPVICYIAFVLYSGLAAAGLPRWMTRSGLSFMGWVVPITMLGFILVFEILSILAQNFTERQRQFYAHYSEWFPLFGSMALAIYFSLGAWYMARRSITFMEKRRAGTWE